MKLHLVAVLKDVFSDEYWDDTNNMFGSFNRASQYTPDSIALRQAAFRATDKNGAVEVKIIYVDDDKI